jgi:anaerobic selenocysteine-containing dehydrogenase
LRNHDEIRAVMARTIPDYSQVSEIGKTRKEFHVEGRVRHERCFLFSDGRARFSVVGTPSDDLDQDELHLMTIRSEGQFNTVVYEEHDRYRNQKSRNVILMNAEDIAKRELHEGDRVAVISETGRMENIRVAAYDISRRCAAMYYPESNALVPSRVDPKSGTPGFKNVRIRVMLRGWTAS